MRQKCLVFILVILCIGFCPFSWAERVVSDMEAWQTVTLSLPVSERLRLNLLAQPRQSDLLRQGDSFFLFADLNCFLDAEKHWAVGAGYVWGPSFNGGFRNEHRVSEQIMYSREVPLGHLFIRNRLEQRFIEDAGSVANWNRTLVQIRHPLKRFPGWSVTVGDEVLVQLYAVNNGPKGGLDQNRTFVMLGKDIGKHARLEGGYMLLWRHRPGDTPERLSHVLLTQLSLY